MRESIQHRCRRQFLRFLAASPLMAYAAGDVSARQATGTAAKDVLNVMDFESLARMTLPPAHWGYVASGVDDDLTARKQLHQIAAEHHGVGMIAGAPCERSGVSDVVDSDLCPLAGVPVRERPATNLQLESGMRVPGPFREPAWQIHSR